ncbi:hypothetical protein ACSBR2_036076 [Camellia fascicularis]
MVTRNSTWIIGMLNPISCIELTQLKLHNCICKLLEAFVGFRNLISLHFEKMAFAANIFETLVPSVPLPETLNFSGCTGIEHFNIHFPKLKTFVATDSCDAKSISFQIRDNAVEPVPRYLEALGCMYQLLNQLRTVKITSIKGLRAELLLIKCILTCSLVLEMICVQYHQIFDAHEGFRISTEMMRFSQASPGAEIVYVKP